VNCVEFQSINYRSFGIIVGSRDMENTYKVNTYSGYQNNGEALFPRLFWRKKHIMARISSKEHDVKDLEAMFYWLEKIISTLKELVI